LGVVAVAPTVIEGLGKDEFSPVGEYDVPIYTRKEFEKDAEKIFRIEPDWRDNYKMFNHGQTTRTPFLDFVQTRAERRGEHFTDRQLAMFRDIRDELE